MVYAVTITYFDGINDTELTSNSLFIGESYEDVIENATSFYGNDIIEISIRTLSPDRFIEFTDSEYFSEFIKKIEENAIW